MSSGGKALKTFLTQYLKLFKFGQSVYLVLCIMVVCLVDVQAFCFQGQIVIWAIV